ncbi:MAG: hypothetical protein WCC87_13150 [Candidatus Korobacteraceae bacterium]
MKRAMRSVGWLMMGALLCLAPNLFAGTSLQINDPPSNNVLDGIYVGSYSATNTATGTQTQIICDDFKDESNYSQASYTVNTFNNLGSTLWGSWLMSAQGGHESLASVTTLYDEAAWLALGMLSKNGTTQGYYSYAIWAVFDASEVANWLTQSGDSAACNAVFGGGSWGTGGCTQGSGGLEGLADGQAYYSGEFSNLDILTPVCGGSGGPGNCQEQEFFMLVPEGGSPLMYLVLAGIACFGAMFYSRRAGVKGGVA